MPTLPRLPVLWAGSRGPLPLFSRHGGCGYGSPAAIPGRTLLRAGVALWGWQEGVPGGVPRAFVRGVWGEALNLPRLPVRRAGSRDPLPTGCGCGFAGVGTRHWPVGLHALPDTACRGGGSWLPGGTPHAKVRGV